MNNAPFSLNSLIRAAGACVLLAATLGGCDPMVSGGDLPDGIDLDPGSAGALKADGAEQLGPQTCSGSESVQLAPNAVVISRDGEALVVVTPTEDPKLKLGGATTTKYTCTCEAPSGSCNPNMSPDYSVNCLPSGCQTEQGGACKLNSSSTFTFEEARDVAERRACESGAHDPKVAEARAAQLAEALKKGSIAPAKFSQNGTTATAPKGHALVAEHVGGLWLVYATDEANLDADGNLKGAVGPAGDGAVLQLAAGNKAKCYCGGGGSCSWSGDGFGICQGNCYDSQQQSQCTVEIKQKK